MPESQDDYVGLPFELENVVQLDAAPFYLGGGGFQPLREPDVVIVNARRPYGGTSVPKFLRSVPFFEPNEPVPVDPWVLKTNPCAEVPNSSGRKLLYTETEDGTNVLVVPPNFSFQAITTKANQMKAEANSITPGNTAAAAMQSAYILSAFKDIVKSKAPYDWKVSGQGAKNPNGTWVTFIRNGEPTRVYEPFGNWSYGFFGAMLGIPREVLLVGGQYAQLRENFKFDDPIDQANINLGITAFQNAYLPIGSNDPGSATNVIIAALITC